VIRGVAPPATATLTTVSRTGVDVEPRGRWVALGVLSLGILLAEAPYFSSSAVTPLLVDAWHPTGIELPMLLVAVQLGFAAGAILLAATGAADVIRGDRLFFAGAIVTAAGNLGFAWVATDAVSALPFRALTGAGIAAVYPVGMKLISGWFRRSRGMAIGVLIGALAVGTASPHLLRAIGALGDTDWRVIVTWASISAALGGVAVFLWVRAGPFDVPSPRFSIRIAARAFAEPSVRLANLGYLGHMWELFAMWTWVPLFLAATFRATGIDDPGAAALAAFTVIGAGGLGCALGGLVADRFGRTTLTIAAMSASGTCALLIGFLFGAPPLAVLALGIVWGATVVADSPQFSAAISELSPPGTAGSALALQTAIGFVLTATTILAVGVVAPVDGAGWRIAFASLALGPMVGVVAMWRLRQRPEAVRMAGGRR
jgi:MFS family permease